MYAGQIIKLIRTVEGLAQGTLAKKLKVTRAYLCQIENGRKQPSLSFLKRFSQQFNVPLPLLFIGEQENNYDDDVFSELRKILAELLTARSSQLHAQTQSKL